MVNTRGKIRKTQHTRKTLFSQASITESDHQSTDSGALIGSNEDLLTEILLRLPVTSVLRFKSVSKHWLSFLSHRRFTTLYEKISNSPGLFVRGLYKPFDVENKNTPPFRKLDFCNDLNGLRIMQSCNGLLLCCSDRGYQCKRKYYVFNPTTKQFAILSVPGGKDFRENIRYIGLAYNKEDCADYKIVCILRVKPNGVLHQTVEQDLLQIQIYSSGTGKWKTVNAYSSVDRYTSFLCGVYWNGAIHWAQGSEPLYFNLEVEQFRKLPLPMTTMYSLFYFGESLGHLHMVVRPVVMSNPVNDHLHLNVYEMLGDRSGWVLKYKVELNELAFAYPESSLIYLPPSSPHYYRFEVLDVVRGEKEEDTFMVLRVPGKIIRYNVLDKCFNQIYDLKAQIGDIGQSEVHRYTETISYF